MAFKVRESITINQSREEVWDYVTEHDEWRRPEIVNVRKLTEGPPGESTRYEDTAKMMGREMTIVNEILRFEPPRYLSWTQVDEGGPTKTVKGSYELKSENGGTHFTLYGEYEASGLLKLLVPLIRRQLQKSTYPRFLRQLKETLESES